MILLPDIANYIHSNPTSLDLSLQGTWTADRKFSYSPDIQKPNKVGYSQPVMGCHPTASSRRQLRKPIPKRICIQVCLLTFLLLVD